MPLYEKLYGYGRLIVCAPVVSWRQFSSQVGRATGMPLGPSRLRPKPNSRKNQTKSPPSTTLYALPVPWCESLQASVICSLIVVDLEYYLLATLNPLDLGTQVSIVFKYKTAIPVYFILLNHEVIFFLKIFKTSFQEEKYKTRMIVHPLSATMWAKCLF